MGSEQRVRCPLVGPNRLRHAGGKAVPALDGSRKTHTAGVEFRIAVGYIFTAVMRYSYVKSWGIVLL
jgi:hypothetical protein